MAWHAVKRRGTAPLLFGFTNRDSQPPEAGEPRRSAFAKATADEQALRPTKQTAFSKGGYNNRTAVSARGCNRFRFSQVMISCF
jgi:hypothetical protein